MDLLTSWLEDAGIHSQSLEQDFSNGYLFAALLNTYQLQPDLAAFQNKGKPDAYLNNYKRLQPTLSNLGVNFDTRTAQALINKEPGLAPKVLLAIKQQLEGLATNLQSAGHVSKTLQQCTVRTSPCRGLLQAQKHKSQYATLDASNSMFFEDVMRKHSSSPNMLMESLHLKHFSDEGSRQAMAAAAAAAATAASEAAGRADMRDSLRSKMAAARSDKASKLQRDEAIHAAILRHQDDVERQELRVETALAELSSHRHHEQRRAAAVDAAAGIDAFEMTLKRLGAAGSKSKADQPGPAVDESPVTTLGRIRSFAPTAAKLADSKDEYLSVIKSRRQEEAAARKEREGRRRRMLVEQQAARAAAEGRVEADCLLEVLVRRSAEEQKLAQHLWQLQQEKAAMEAGRRLREEQYAALKDKEWEDNLRRENEMHRALQSEHADTVQQELAAWRQQQEGDKQAAAKDRDAFGRSTAWQLVQLAERVVEYRSATGGQAVPLADWRAWLSLFLAGDTSLGSPIVNSDPAALQEAPTPQMIINTAELMDYLCCKGAWLMDAVPAADSSSAGGRSNGSRPTTPAAVPPTAAPQKALAEVVTELARLAQKLRSSLEASQCAPSQQQLPHQQQQAQEGPDACGTGTDEPERAHAPEPVASAAEAASKSGAAPGADVIHSMPLKLAVVGSPFSGKSTVANTVAQAFGLKLLSPQQLVTEAVAAATAWRQQQQQQQQQQQPDSARPAAAEPADASLTPAAVSAQSTQNSQAPSLLVTLGLHADAQLQAGEAVSDQVVVQLLLLGMQQAKSFVPPAPEPAQPEPSAKGSKGPAGKSAAGGKSEPGAASSAGGRHASNSGCSTSGGVAGSPTVGVAATLAAGLGSSPPGPVLPANLAAGVPGRGVVIDGFPATEAQAVLLEKALTGLDLAAEQQLVQQASLIAPPPPAKLPQLQRPLLSGLDAVVMLECADAGLALQRVLGKRLDPVTGHVYHLDSDPPPANNPGLCERLVQPPGQEEEACKVPECLAAWAASSSALNGWLARFSSLRRPLDASMMLAEVVLAAGDVVSGILSAKGAAQAAQAAAVAARQAQTSAEKAQELSVKSQLHAEAAAHDLLAAKKAEMQVLPLLTGGKNPDPGAAELLKAQAAAKCAEQLKACHAAAVDAAAQADHARAAAETAANAVLSCKRSVGDAAVSAEAQALASKAAVDAEAAATAALQAADKAQAAKELSDGYAQDAQKWSAAAEVPMDASIPSAVPAAQASSNAPAAAAPASSRPVSAKGITAAQASAKGGAGPSPLQASSTAPALAASSGNACSDLSLMPAGCLPAPLAVALHEEWAALERMYVEGMGRGFAGLREAHSLALNQVAATRSWFSALLQQPDSRQVLLQEFVSRFNAVGLDMRKADETKGELLLRCEELRDALWALCDTKHEVAEASRLKVANDGSAAEQVALIGVQLASLVQVELDRFVSTAQFLWSYCHASHGVHHPALPDKAFAHVNVLAGHESSSKAEQGRASVVTSVNVLQLTSLQQRLPQLASALKTALGAATAVETQTLSSVSDALQKAVAAAAHAVATANAAAAAAAAAAGQSSSGAAAHRQAPTSTAKGTAGAAGPATGSAAAAAANSKASNAATAASTKLAASYEEAAAAAAAAATVLAAMPDQAVLAAVHAELQAMLGAELALLQQRLSMLSRRACVLVEEAVQLHATTNSDLAEWAHRRYVAECGAVAALERVVKAAAAAGKPLAQDLRLEDEFLVVDSTQQLVPPPIDQPPQRPASPPLPPGVLSVEQLHAAAAAMQSAQQPAGFLSVQAAADLLMGLSSQGVLPAAWHEVHASHMAAALAAFDPTYSDYLDWRELLLALAAAAFPAIHTATAAQMAMQALQLAAADGDGDGRLTQQEFDGLTWWFMPRPEMVQEAETEPTQHADVLSELSRCKKLSQLFWDVFKQPAAPVVCSTTVVHSEPAPPAAAGHQDPGTDTRAAGGSRPGSAATATAHSLVAAAAAAGGGELQYVVPAQALLLYLCIDRDLYAGITKAVSVVAQRAGAGTTVDGKGVLRICYPLIEPVQAVSVCRAPLTAQQVAAAVSAAAAAPTTTAFAASTVAANKSSSSGGLASRKPSSPGGPAVANRQPDPQAQLPEADAPSLKPSQLMYSAACERIVALLLHRYQWKDVHVSALL